MEIVISKILNNWVVCFSTNQVTGFVILCKLHPFKADLRVLGYMSHNNTVRPRKTLASLLEL